LRNEELHNLYPWPDIIRMIKSTRIIYAGRVARVGRRGIHDRFFVGKPEGERPQGMPRRKWGAVHTSSCFSNVHFVSEGIILKWTLEK
jgi:hypothetical protein